MKWRYGPDVFALKVCIQLLREMKICQYVNHDVPAMGRKNEQLLFLSEKGCRCAKACKN